MNQELSEYLKNVKTCCPNLVKIIDLNNLGYKLQEYDKKTKTLLFIDKNNIKKEIKEETDLPEKYDVMLDLMLKQNYVELTEEEQKTFKDIISLILAGEIDLGEFCNDLNAFLTPLITFSELKTQLNEVYYEKQYLSITYIYNKVQYDKYKAADRKTRRSIDPGHVKTPYNTVATTENEDIVLRESSSSLHIKENKNCFYELIVKDNTNLYGKYPVLIICYCNNCNYEQKFDNFL